MLLVQSGTQYACRSDRIAANYGKASWLRSGGLAGVGATGECVPDKTGNTMERLALGTARLVMGWVASALKTVADPLC